MGHKTKAEEPRREHARPRRRIGRVVMALLLAVAAVAVLYLWPLPESTVSASSTAPAIVAAPPTPSPAATVPLAPADPIGNSPETPPSDLPPGLAPSEPSAVSRPGGTRPSAPPDEETPSDPRPIPPYPQTPIPPRPEGPITRPNVPPPFSIAKPAPEGLGLLNGEVFGQTVLGVTPDLLERLKDAERLAGLEIRSDGGTVSREQWGIFTLVGYRSGSRAHSTGRAVDLNYYSNPYIMHEAGETALDAELGPVYHRIARLMLGRESVIPEEITHGAPGLERTMKLYGQLREESQAMADYFRLMPDRTRVSRRLAALRQPKPPSFWRELLPGGAEPAADALQRQMMADYVVLSGRPGPAVQGLEYPPAATTARDSGPTADRPFEGEPRYRAPEFGFLDLREEVVRGLTQAGIRWGGTDMGRQSGDLMHFYLPRSSSTVASSSR
jgi:hypothetical protein